VTRIHVIGPPGSGKSTLAQRLASLLDVPYYELDSFAWEEGYQGTDRPLSARLHDVHDIATQPGWVTEGIFLFWTDELLRTADYIVWLDMPWYVIIPRLLRRRLDWMRSDLGDLTPPTNPFRQLQLLKHIAVYYLSRMHTNTRAFTFRYLMAHKEKLTHCRHSSEAETFFKRIQTQEQASKNRAQALEQASKNHAQEQSCMVGR